MFWIVVVMMVMLMLNLLAFQTVFSLPRAFHTVFMLDAFSIWAVVLIVIHLAMRWLVFL
jgi:hypothetical protein